MQQYQKYFKPAAICCCLLYLIFVLALPFIGVQAGSLARGLGASSDTETASFSDVMDDTGWPILAIIASVAMAACVWFLPGKQAAIACAVGAFLALVSFWLTKGYYNDQMGGFSSYVSFKIGAGPILGLIFGLIAAVLCFMSDQGPRKDTTPGVGRGNGNEW